MTEPSIPSTPDQSGEPNNAPPLHWYCWVHDTPEECEKGACGLGYWLCPECKSAMQHDGGRFRSPAYEGVWRCEECDTFIDFATLRPASSLAPSGESGVPNDAGTAIPTCHCENGLGLPHSLHEFCTPVSSLQVTPPSRAENRPVSSPEKPDEDRLVMHSSSITLGPEYGGASSSLPTDEEVERLVDELVSATREYQHTVSIQDWQAGVMRLSKQHKAERALRDCIASLHRDLEEARKEIDHATQIAKAALDDGSTDVQFHTVGEWMAALWRSRNLWKGSFETAERERDEARKAHFPNCPAHPDIAQCVCDLIASRSIHPTQTD